MSEEKSDSLLTVQEVAKRLRVDNATIRRWIASVTLEVVVLPHRGRKRVYRIPQATLDVLLQTSPTCSHFF